MEVFICSLFTLILISHGGGTISLAAILLVIYGTWVISLSGLFCLTVTGTTLKCHRLVALVVGFIIVSLILNIVLMFSLSIQAHFLFAILSIGIIILANKLLTHNIYDLFLTTKEILCDNWALLSLSAFVLLWTWNVIPSFNSLEQSGILPAWVDYFLHGDEIAQFSDLKAVGKGSILLAGKPLTFYHRGIYIIPAVIAGLCNMSGVAAATSLLLPIGLLLLGIAIYSLGATLKDRTVGISAVICLYVLPDSSLYGLKNGFFGLHHSLFVAPGTAYGIAICIIATVFLVYALRKQESSRRFFAIAFFILSTAFLFRVHFFILYLPVLTGFYLLNKLLLNNHKTGLLKLLLGFLIVLIFMYAFSETFHKLIINKSVVLDFFRTVHLERGENAYSEYYHYIYNNKSIGLRIIFGFLFLFPAILGVWLLIFPLSLYLKVRQAGWDEIDNLCIILLVVYFLLVLFAPSPWQNQVTEFQHRPFGLIYALLVIFSVAYLSRVLDSVWIKSSKIQYTAVSVGYIGVISSLILADNSFLQMLFHGSTLYGYIYRSYRHDIIKSAVLLRRDAVNGDIFLVSEDDTDRTFIDSSSVISSIAGLPAYLGGVGIPSKVKNITRKTIKYRLNVAKSILETTNSQDAFHLMLKQGINWYFALKPPKWDSHQKLAYFVNDKVSLYRLNQKGFMYG